MSDSQGTSDEQRDAFVGKLMQAVTGSLTLFSVYIGVKLGFYAALAAEGSLTSAGLAKATASDERYGREWLEQQTLNGILAVEDEGLAADQRRYYLPPAHAEPLLDRDSPNYMTPMVQMLVGMVHPLEDVLEAYHTGAGVPYAAYGADMRESQGESNRYNFLFKLAQVWLPTMPDVQARLQSPEPARVADIGCGYGWSSIAMAQGYPNVQVDGFDLDAPSIAAACENARQYGVESKVQFYVRDAGDPALAGSYDLVTAFECVHDLSDPVTVLQSMRRLLKPGGTVLIADARAAEAFTTRGADIEAIMYSVSILHCLPVGRDGPHAVGTGTVMRPETFKSYANQAGFSTIEVLPIDDYAFWRFYRLKP